MNPAIKGYFKLDQSRYALVSELEVRVLYGLKPRCSLGWKVWTWFNADYSGLPSVYKYDAEIQWFADLESRAYSIDELEALAIEHTLTMRLDASPRLKHPRRDFLRHNQFTPVGEAPHLIDPATSVQIYGNQALECLIRDIDTHELKRRETVVDYIAAYSLSGNAERYPDTLSYNSTEPTLCSDTLATPTLFQQCAAQFITQYLHLETPGL